MDSRVIPVEQAALAQALHARIDACRRLADGADNSTDVQIAVVLGDLDLTAVVHALRAACANTPPDVLRQWAANFTKVIVLAGNPDKLVSRFRALPIVMHGKIAVVGPAPASALSGLRRLLRPLQGGDPGQEISELLVPLDAAASHALELTISSRRSLGEFLVSLSHTVAEATLFGHFAQAAALSIRLVADLERLSEHDLYARVQPASDEYPSLRVHARLRRVARVLPSATELRS